MKLVFASNNTHKLEEVRQILPVEVQVLSLREIGFLQEIDETGDTLEANSALKAHTVWKWLCEKGLVENVDGVFADDTGLEIVALGGAPGVRTARWAGDEACDMNNRQKALHELLGKEDRSARFRTVVTLIKHGEMQQVEGIVNGTIALQEEGTGGFGYDPVFIPEGYDSTFASLPTTVKNSISHRSRAMEALKRILS
ncbi:MAG: RdgB/HAM1 family non-canonical purine NTP pyrophosphatase [Paludibacteraceae bacterium]|nr:RdgB/HAM1 family non-canonical purine NTP pyrophosphatase [Paludibacteraceae bacterium]